MKHTLLIFIISLFAGTGISQAQESPLFAVGCFDVVESGDTIRYYSQIIPLSSGSDLACVENELLKSFVASTGHDNLVFKTMQTAVTESAADKMVVEEMTIPGRKRGWFKATFNCH